MKIYKITTEHTKYGGNWASYNIAARTMAEALRRVKGLLIRGERPESVIQLAATD